MTMATATAGCSSSPVTPVSSTITIQANANGPNAQLPLIVMVKN